MPGSRFAPTVSSEISLKSPALALPRKLRSARECRAFYSKPGARDPVTRKQPVAGRSGRKSGAHSAKRSSAFWSNFRLKLGRAADGRSARHLQQSVGSAHEDIFDFDALSRMLSASLPAQAFPGSRRQRIRGLLSVLGSQQFFPAPAMPATSSPATQPAPEAAPAAAEAQAERSPD